VHPDHDDEHDAAGADDDEYDAAGADDDEHHDQYHDDDPVGGAPPAVGGVRHNVKGPVTSR
jgi:hypothetical protein